MPPTEHHPASLTVMRAVRPGPERNRWAELMQRTFEVDVLACPRCGGRLRLVALIQQASVIKRILRHLGLPTDVPEPRPARAATPALSLNRGSVAQHLRIRRRLVTTQASRGEGGAEAACLPRRSF